MEVLKTASTLALGDTRAHTHTHDNTCEICLGPTLHILLSKVGIGGVILPHC